LIAVIGSISGRKGTARSVAAFFRLLVLSVRSRRKREAGFEA
jgi:hypothetical protein